MAKTFAQQVGAWASETAERLDAVHARSVELLGAEMSKSVKEGGAVPFDTGNLTNSLLASTSGMPSTSEGPHFGSDVGAVTATLTAGTTVWLGYQAVYARRRNYGFIGADSLGRVYNEQGAYFVESALADWPRIVNEAVSDVRGGR